MPSKCRHRICKLLPLYYVFNFISIYCSLKCIFNCNEVQFTYFSLFVMCFVPDLQICYKIKGYRMSYILLIHLYCSNATNSFDYWIFVVSTIVINVSDFFVILLDTRLFRVLPIFIWIFFVSIFCKDASRHFKMRMNKK